jgi:hypothetical protein
MNSEIKAKWLQALRSGEYKQTRYTLRSCTGGFCCLGVLSDIYRKEVGGSWKWNYNNDTAYSIVNESEDDFATVELPDCVMEWAGLDYTNPECKVMDKENEFVWSTLSSLNDGGESFSFIADVIDDQF